LGSLQSSWLLIDFYWNREDYTQKYCLLLDEGVTQCRASCYLDNLLEEKKKDPAKTHINSYQKVKIAEITHDEELSLHTFIGIQNYNAGYPPDGYHFDFHYSIFHPPKSQI